MQGITSSVIPIPGSNSLRAIGDPPSATATSPNPPATAPSTVTSPNATGTSGGARPRRPRSRRDRDKRFTCDVEGCDKTYTRAEHLTRHQLNHQGAYKFVCRVDPRCGKRFVRGDLLTRHEDRHRNRKNRQAMSEDGHSPPARIAPSPPSAPSPTTELANQMNRSITIPMSSPGSEAPYDDRSDDVLSSPDDMAIDNAGYHYHSPTPNRQGFPPNFTTNPQTSYVHPALSPSPPTYSGSFVPITQGFSPNQVPVLDASPRGYAVPSEPMPIPQTGYTSGTQDFSPPQANTNVFASFFTGGEMLGDMGVHQVHENWLDIYNPNNAAQHLSWENNQTWNDQFPEITQIYPAQPPAGAQYDGRRGSVYYATPIPVGALLSDDPTFQSTPIITQEVRDIILTEHLKWALNSQMVLQNAANLTPEALSDYVNIYWREFHTQYPILHRPTTTINNNAHLSLFIAMITIGMSLGGDNNAHNLAVAIHDELRWQIYSSKTFRHPAKLWEMQTLLLREIFDKMLCGRHQHEMAHTFHGALLTLMRRGTTLDGFLFRDEQENMSVENTQGSSELQQRWHDFVEQECTKRVAYLAFIIDSQHAMIFGHPLVLHAQELNLKPPCKEDLWAAGSPVEWQRVMQRNNLDDLNSSDEPGFIEILKMFMNEPATAKDKVQLDSFGSFIVLHGLFSVTWHLQQKALGSLGVTTNTASRAGSPSPKSSRERDHWKLSIERALNAWRSSTQGTNTANPSIARFNRSSMTLYRIANITLHTKIVDLQVLAGLPKIMGKPVKDDMSINALLRMSTSWANSDGAAKSVLHALKLLTETVFKLGYDYLASRQHGGQDGHFGHFQRMDFALDGILHGKWCLYLATLTLWAWGVVTANNPSREGSVSMNGMSAYTQSVKLEDGDLNFSSYTDDDQVTAWHHAQHYLKCMMAVANERNGLATVPARTETRGLIIIMRNLLMNERWELLREGAALCNKILNNQHRGNSLNPDEIQSLWENRRMSVAGTVGSY